MKTSLLITLTILLANSVVAQSCLYDGGDSSPCAQILTQLKTDGETNYKMTMQASRKTYRGYKLCENSYIQIDSLNNLLTDHQIDTLLNCSNGTMKVAGFILFAKRYNSKDTLLKKLKEIFSHEFIVMAPTCARAFTFSSAGRICYSLLTQSNYFFKPAFELTKVEKRNLERDLAFYEMAMNN